MDELHENPAFVKNSGADCKAQTDGKIMPIKEMTEIHKIKQLEDVSMTEKGLVAGLSAADEAASSSDREKMLAAKNKERKAGENDDISTVRTYGKTKATKKITSNSKINNSKDKTPAKKDVGGDPSIEDEVTSSPDTEKKVSVKNRKHKAEENGEVSNAKINGETKTMKKAALKSKTNKSEDKFEAKKGFVSGLSTADKVTSSSDTEKRKISGHKLVAGILTESKVTSSKVTNKTTTDKTTRKAVINPQVLVEEMVLESKKTLEKRNVEASEEQICAHIFENYETNVKKVIEFYVDECLREGVENGEFEKVIGANGEERFKIKNSANVGKGKENLVKKSPSQKKPRKK